MVQKQFVWFTLMKQAKNCPLYCKTAAVSTMAQSDSYLTIQVPIRFHSSDGLQKDEQ